MAATAVIGRPGAYDEPTKKRNFDLPTSLNERLNAYSKRTKIPAVRIVQDALGRVLPRDGEENNSNALTTQSTARNGSGRSAERLDSPDLETTLRSVLSEVLVHSVPVSVDRVRRGRLEKLAQELGFADERDLLQDLAFRALENPEAAASFLFSQLEQASAATVAAEEAPRKARKKAA